MEQERMFLDNLNKKIDYSNVANFEKLLFRFHDNKHCMSYLNTICPCTVMPQRARLKPIYALRTGQLNASHPPVA